MSTTTLTSAMPSALEKRRPAGRFYPQLDGMRAIAVLLVLLNHMRDLKLPPVLYYASSLGWIGVDAFFVLSGFLITSILLNTEPTARAISRFVLRRTLRTWPLYFVVLFLAYCGFRNVGIHENWVQHLLFVQNYAQEFSLRSLGPTWSLCIEEHFYLVWPFVVFWIPRRYLAWVLAVVLLALPALREWGLHAAFTHKQLYSETQFHLDGLVAGSLVALLLYYVSANAPNVTRIAIVCVASGAISTAWGFRNGWDVIAGHNVVFGFSSLALFFSGLLLFLLQPEQSLLVKSFSVAPLRYIGRISYGIYLLHEGCIALLSRIPLHRFLGSTIDRWSVAIPLRIAFSISVAALSYRFFESPILRLKDRLR